MLNYLYVIKGEVTDCVTREEEVLILFLHTYSAPTSLISTRANSHNERKKCHWEKGALTFRTDGADSCPSSAHSLQLFLVSPHIVKDTNKNVIMLKPTIDNYIL